MESPFIITIVGPESSGKTTLAKHLAEALGCVWVPEYARIYLDGLDKPYEFDDLEIMARGQLGLIEMEIGRWQGARSKGQGAGSKEQGARSREQLTMYQMNNLIEWLTGIKDKVIIVDSGLLSIRMWAMIKYGRKIEFVEEALKKDMTAMYLLTRARKEWEPDPLREAPNVVDRVWIYNQYLNELSRERMRFSIL